MKKLTLRYAVENKFRGVDCVKYFDKNTSDKEADYILWEETCFPFSSEAMIKQLNNKFLNTENTEQVANTAAPH